MLVPLCQESEFVLNHHPVHDDDTVWIDTYFSWRLVASRGSHRHWWWEEGSRIHAERHACSKWDSRHGMYVPKLSLFLFRIKLSWPQLPSDFQSPSLYSSLQTEPSLWYSEEPGYCFVLLLEICCLDFKHQDCHRKWTKPSVFKDYFLYCNIQDLNTCSVDCCEMLLVNAADGEEQIAGGSWSIWRVAVGWISTKLVTVNGTWCSWHQAPAFHPSRCEFLDLE